MRIPALTILTLITVLQTAPAPAQTYSPDYPVCMQAYRWGGSDIDCGYASLAQCAQAAMGLGALCVVNPNYARAMAQPGRSNPRQRRIH